MEQQRQMYAQQQQYQPQVRAVLLARDLTFTDFAFSMRLVGTFLVVTLHSSNSEQIGLTRKELISMAHPRRSGFGGGGMAMPLLGGLAGTSVCWHGLENQRRSRSRRSPLGRSHGRGIR